MSLTYLQNNSFNYQDIPANAIVYRSETSGFTTIQQEQGVLMSDGSTYSFGIPTAAELVTDGVSSFQTTDPAIFRYIDRLPKVNNSVIVPVEFYAYNTEKVTFTRTPDIYVFIKMMMEDSIINIKWCNNRNFVNVLVTSDN